MGNTGTDSCVGAPGVRAAVVGSPRAGAQTEGQPAQPTGLSATAGDGQVALSWTDPNDSSITGYEFTQDDGTNWADISGSGATTTSHTVTGLTNGTTYTFAIRSVGEGTSAASVSVSSTPVAATVSPEKPTGFSAQQNNHLSVRLVWDAAAAPLTVTSYQYTQDGGDNRDDIPDSDSSRVSAVVSELSSGTTYKFALRALNSAGPGEATDSQAVTVVGKPGEVTGFTATPQNGQVWLTWNPANNDSITGWDYWQRTGRAMDQIWSSIAGSGAGTTAHLVTGLTNGQQYRFRLRSVNVAGQSEQTDNKNATPTASQANIRLQPRGLAATPDAGEVTLTWADPNDSSITKYQYTQDGGMTWEDISESGATTTSYTVTGLTNGTQYTFQVRAVNDTGAGTASDTVSATPRLPKPKPPTNFSATAGDMEVMLGWSDPSDSTITHYQYTQDGGASWADIPGSGETTTSYTVTELTNGTQYTFQVRAVNHEGGVSASDRVIITPGRLTVWSATISTKELEDRGDVVARAWSSVENRYSGASLTCGRDTCNTFSYGGETYTIIELRNTIESLIHVIAFAAGTVLPDALEELEFYIGSGISHQWDGRRVRSEIVPVQGTTLIDFGYTGAYIDDLPAGADAKWPTDKPVDISITAPRSVPAKPTGLEAAPGNGEAKLSWDTPDSTITGHQVQQDSGDWDDIPDSAAGEANAASYTVPGLTNGTEYTFALRAVNSVGNGEASDSVTVTPTPDVTGLTLTSAPASAWTREDGVVTGAYGQNEQVTITVTMRDEVTVTETPTLTLDVGGVLRQASYASDDSTPKELAFVYTVVAADEDEDGIAIGADSISLNGGSIRTSGGEDIDLSHAEVAASVAHRVSNVFTWSLSADQTEISEGDSVTVTVTLTGNRDFTTQSESASILVERQGVGGEGVTDDDWEATGALAVEEQSLSYDDFRNDGYNGYRGSLTFTIEAREDGVSEAEETFEIPFQLPGTVTSSPYGDQTLTTPADGTTVLVLVLNTDASAKPTGLEAAPGNGEATLSWANPSDNTIIKYQYTLDGGTNWTDIPDSAPGEDNAFSYTVTRLTNGTEYTFSIRAVNDETRASLPSDEVTVTPNPVPAAPGNLRQDPAVTMGLNFGLSWDDPGDDSITKYEHRRSTDGGEIWDPDWQDTQGVGTGVAFESLEFDVTYTYQLRAVNDVGKGAVASISYTPRRNGAPGNMSGMSCDGNADGAGFGDAVSITSNAYGFDIVAAGVDPTDGSEWWQVEYMEPVADDLDTFHTAWFPAGCFEAVSDALADSIPATWPPVSGEWSFEASIDPNPLESGDENGARVTFTATYTVTSGAPTDLTASIDGDLARVSSVFPGSLLHDDGRIAIGLKLGGNSAGGSNSWCRPTVL